MAIDLKPYVTPEPGERVVLPDHDEGGSVIEVVRQEHTDDLLRVAWDTDTDGADRDLYSWALLEREAATSGTKGGPDA